MYAPANQRPGSESVEDRTLTPGDGPGDVPADHGGMGVEDSPATKYSANAALADRLHTGSTTEPESDEELGPLAKKSVSGFTRRFLSI
jgi:hypothetical protein